MNTLEMIVSKMAFKMAQQMKALTAKLEDPSLVQGPHTKEREPMPAHCAMTSTKSLWHACPCPPTTK